MRRGRKDLALATLLAALAMVSPFSIDTFFPSFPAIAAEYDVGVWQLQQTLTAYLLPYGVMALMHGPLSDTFGRRPVVLAGMGLYALASVACALAPSFASLLVFRALQGMTAGAGLVVGRAVIRDLYQGAQAQRLMSVVTLIFGVAPAVAPIIGGWVHVWFGWRAVFVFMVLIGVALVLASQLGLPETHPPSRRLPFHPATLLRVAGSIAANREFALLALSAACNFASIIVFVGAAPSIVLEHWHLAETDFAWLFIPLIAGFMLGASLSGRFAGRLSPARQVNAGFVLNLVAAALLLAFTAAARSLILPQQLLLFALGIGAQLAFPVLTLRMLDLYPHARGSAASVQSFVSLMVTSAVMGVAVPLLHHSLAFIASGALVAALLAFLLWRLAEHLRPCRLVHEDAVSPPEL